MFLISGLIFKIKKSRYIVSTCRILMFNNNYKHLAIFFKD